MLINEIIPFSGQKVIVTCIKYKVSGIMQQPYKLYGTEYVVVQKDNLFHYNLRLGNIVSIEPQPSKYKVEILDESQYAANQHS
jgi:hypothetical protein